MKNKTYIPEKQIAVEITTLNQILPEGTKTQINKIASKTGLNLYHRSKMENMSKFWLKTIAEMDALPVADPWRKQMQEHFAWNNRTEAKYILEYMDHAGTRKEYQTVCAWDPRELVFYLGHIADKYHLPQITVEECFKLETKSLFTSYSKSNCDKAALDLTKNTIKALDSLFADADADMRFRIQNVVNIYLNSDTVDFDQIHEIINQP